MNTYIPATALPKLKGDLQIVYDWLAVNVFKINTPQGKDKLMDYAFLSSKLGRAKNLGVAKVNSFNYSYYPSSFKNFAFLPEVTDVWIDKLINRKYLRQTKAVAIRGADGYPVPRVCYITMRLPGETEAEHKERHKMLVEKRVAERKILFKTNELVQNEKAVRELQDEVLLLETQLGEAKTMINKQLNHLNRQIAQEAKTNKLPLTDAISGMTPWIKAVEDAVAVREAKSLELKTKKEELANLKKTLKKPVRGLVANPEAMNL